jgi:outer membrane protein assembly factor BamB
VDGKVIVEVLHGMKTDDPSYLLALNAADGKVLWRVERATDAVFESPDAYTTPAVLVIGGKKQLVVSGGDYVTGHDAENRRRNLALERLESAEGAGLSDRAVADGAGRNDFCADAEGAAAGSAGRRHRRHFDEPSRLEVDR